MYLALDLAFAGTWEPVFVRSSHSEFRDIAGSDRQLEHVPTVGRFNAGGFFQFTLHQGKVRGGDHGRNAALLRVQTTLVRG